MKKILENIAKIFQKLKRIVVFFLIIAAAAYFMNSFYSLLNPKSDVGYENKVREETQAKEVRFDSKVIKNIIEKEIEGQKAPLVTEGKNPFLIY